jgi:hypothetical protein
MIVGMLAGWLRSEHRPPQQPSRAVAVYAGGSARALIKPRRVMDAQPKLSEAVVQQLVALPAGCGRMWRSGTGTAAAAAWLPEPEACCHIHA